MFCIFENPVVGWDNIPLCQKWFGLFHLLAQCSMITNCCPFLEQDGYAMFFEGQTNTLHKTISAGILFLSRAR